MARKKKKNSTEIFMAGDSTIAQHLEDTKGFNDLDTPVVVTSGEFLTPFFVNAEKLCRDKDISSFLKKHGESSAEVVDHSVYLATNNTDFREDIATLAYNISSMLPNEGRVAISGGQTRDWIFSGPIAKMLGDGGLPHISLYKQNEDHPDKAEIIYPDGRIGPAEDLSGYHVVHVVDLITKGSSVYSTDNQGNEKGWVPMLRSRGAKVNDLVAVVTRLQGGEESLAEQGVKVHASVAIDRPFLIEHSSQLNVDERYVEDPVQWTEDYLKANSTSVLVPYFVDDEKKLPRARKFMANYSEFLEESGLMPQLERQVQEAYGKKVSDIVGGR